MWKELEILRKQYLDLELNQAIDYEFTDNKACRNNCNDNNISNVVATVFPLPESVNEKTKTTQECHCSNYSENFTDRLFDFISHQRKRRKK